MVLGGLIFRSFWGSGNSGPFEHRLRGLSCEEKTTLADLLKQLKVQPQEFRFRVQGSGFSEKHKTNEMEREDL